MQDSTKSRNAKARDKQQYNFFVTSLKNLFMTLDELINSQNPFFSETVSIFSDVVKEILNLEPCLSSSIILGFEKLLSKFSDYSHLVSPSDFEKITSAFSSIMILQFKSHSVTTSGPTEPKPNVLSDEKMGIIEYLDAERQIDMTNALIVSHALSTLSTCFHYLLESRISWEHWAGISRLMSPFAKIFLENAKQAEDNFEYIVQTAHLVSLIMRTEKCEIELDAPSVNSLFEALFRKMASRSSETLSRRYLMISVTIANLKKVIGNSRIGMNSCTLFGGSSECELSPLVESLIMKLIGEGPPDVDLSFKLFDILSLLFDLIFEISRTAKRRSQSVMIEVQDVMRDVATRSISLLDRLKRVKGVKGKMTERILLRVWSINDMLSQ